MAALYRPGILACDLGGTQLRTAVVDASGAVAHRRAVPTPKDDPEALAALLRDALAEAGEVEGVVAGVPGPIDYAAGAPTMLVNLPAWESHVSESALSDGLGLDVLLANDADLAALGEHRFGAGRDFDDIAYVTVSTGVGAGVVLGGRLVRGRLSLAELGHTIIDRHTMQTVEDLGSGTALGRLAGEGAAAVSARGSAGRRRGGGPVQEGGGRPRRRRVQPGASLLAAGSRRRRRHVAGGRPAARPRTRNAGSVPRLMPCVEGLGGAGRCGRRCGTQGRGGLLGGRAVLIPEARLSGQ